MANQVFKRPAFIGASGATTFSTLTELYDDIAGGFTGEWRIDWSGDTYVADGYLIGDVVGGKPIPHPFTQGVDIPSWLIDSSEWSLVGGSASSNHTIGADGDGRLQISQAAGGLGTGPHLTRLADRYSFRRPVHCEFWIDHNLAGQDSSDNRWGCGLVNIANTDDYIHGYLRDIGASLDFNFIVRDDASSLSASGTGEPQADPWVGIVTIDASRFAAASPTFGYQMILDSGGSYSRLTRSNNHGDWQADTGYDYVPAIYMTAFDTNPVLTLRSFMFEAESS